ncbi:MAG: hypothetical protein NVSMB13_19160 [Mycobacteriales bacterium]
MTEFQTTQTPPTATRETSTQPATSGDGPVPAATTAAALAAGTVGQLLLRPDEAAALLRASRSKVYELMRRGEIVSVLIGGSRRVPRAALISYVEALTAAAERDAEDRRRGWSTDWQRYGLNLPA